MSKIWEWVRYHMIMIAITLPRTELLKIQETLHIFCCTSVYQTHQTKKICNETE